MRSEARHTRDGAGEGPRASGPRPLHAWSVLHRDQRLAALAALALFVSMLLPWYQQNAVVAGAKRGALVSQNLNAFAVFSFVEAAVLLVALAVLFLLYRRAEGASFHLPGSDGAVIFAAGLWAGLLLVLRLFDKPGITHNGVAANVGVQWGIFFALGAAGLLAYAGSRMRAARAPEAPLVRREPAPPPPRSPFPAERPDAPVVPRHERRAPEDAQTVIVPRGERPPYPPAPAQRSPRGAGSEDDTVRAATPGAATPRLAAEQLSFEDAPPSE